VAGEKKGNAMSGVSVPSTRPGRLALAVIRTIALIGALALAGLLPFLQHAHAQERANWTGVWDTKWRGGGAQIKLEQTGAEVKGVYPLYNGRIEAKAEACRT
jgi:MscS family membrane protein